MAAKESATNSGISNRSDPGIETLNKRHAKRRRTRQFVNYRGFFAALVLLCSGNSSAAIISLSGNVIESQVFIEDSAQVFLQDVRNTIADRHFFLGFPFSTASPVVIPAGTLIYEYFFNFSPASFLGSANGSVTFDRDVLGIDGAASALEEIDVFGFPNTADTLSLSTDHRTVSFSLNVNGGSDGFLIFVAAEPSSLVSEPGSVALLGTAWAAMSLSRRRRKSEYYV